MNVTPIITRLLGKKVKDRITGLEGIATSVSFDLYGCVQVIVNPGKDKDGKPQDLHWFDEKRIEILSDGPMPLPTFENIPGPEHKPAPAQ